MKNTLMCLLLAVLLSFSAFAAFEKTATYDNNFSDVPETSWYAENVKTAYELGFMNGKAEGLFDPAGNVTVAEGITMACRVHAIYNGTEVTKKEKVVEAYVLDFGEEVTHSYKPNQATGEVSDGAYVLTPFEVSYGQTGYDPGLFLDNLNLPARDYTKAVIKFAYEPLDNKDPSLKRSEWGELYFATNNDRILNETKKFGFEIMPFLADDGWFYVELDLTRKEVWKDTIIQMRFDPTQNNGIYYIESISFMKNEDPKAEKWYDMYIDYALDNELMASDTFDSFTRNITRAELAYLFASAVPASEFAAINEVSGIPDLDKNNYYTDTLLMLYRAGIVLGSEGGYFKPDDDIKRNETAAIINRIALPENRVKGTVDYVYDDATYLWDKEYDSEEEIADTSFEAESAVVENGMLVLTAKPSTATKTGYDPVLQIKNTEIDATEYSKIKIRIKPEFFEGQDINYECQIYFGTEEKPGLSEGQSYHFDALANSHRDPEGWYVLDIDMSLANGWTGKIVTFRFDPTNMGGVYYIDYIRFIKTNASSKISDEELEKNYVATRMFKDEAWEYGFTVNKPDQTGIAGDWTYSDSEQAPLWTVGPWWTNSCLIEDRLDTGDKYTLTDKQGTKLLRYNPEEKSLTFKLDGTKIYEGRAAKSNAEEMWPHLLIAQSGFGNFSKLSEEDQARFTAEADKIYLEMDIRLTDFTPTTNAEGVNATQFLTYFYLTLKDYPGSKIWFGADLFDDRMGGRQKTNWMLDRTSNQMIYCVSTADTYGGLENSFNAGGEVNVSDEWKHIRLDLTPHIERCIALANKEMTFGTKVSIEDFYFNGCNLGFEMHGNYDCTFEVKNFNLVSYNKK